MSRPALEVADVFRDHGPAWRQANAGHVSLDQLKVMSAIERCRTAALGGHVERCEDCTYTTIAYNSCRNRHCPKCQSAAAREWLAEREAELLPVPYFHVVFTLPARIASIAYQNKAVVYDLLFKASSEAVLTIAADPEHLGARIGITAVLHTWGSTMTHHPHVHMIVPGGGIALDGKRWLSCQPRFLLPVPVLTKLFQGLMLAKLLAAHKAGRLTFFGQHAHLAERKAFAAYLAPLRRINWYVYSKPPFGGPKAVLAYLSRYTHRVAISNRRLITFDQHGVTFRYKDYCADGREFFGQHAVAATEIEDALPWLRLKQLEHRLAKGRDKCGVGRVTGSVPGLRGHPRYCSRDEIESRAGKIRRLFVAQRDDRIDAHCAPCRDSTCRTRQSQRGQLRLPRKRLHLWGTP